MASEPQQWVGIAADLMRAPAIGWLASTPTRYVKTSPIPSLVDEALSFSMGVTPQLDDRIQSLRLSELDAKSQRAGAGMSIGMGSQWPSTRHGWDRIIRLDERAEFLARRLLGSGEDDPSMRDPCHCGLEGATPANTLQRPLTSWTPRLAARSIPRDARSPPSSSCSTLLLICRFLQLSSKCPTSHLLSYPPSPPRPQFPPPLRPPRSHPPLPPPLPHARAASARPQPPTGSEAPSLQPRLPVLRVLRSVAFQEGRRACLRSSRSVRRKARIGRARDDV